MSSVAVPRTIFDESHDDFRDTVRRFVQREVSPHLEAWTEAGRVDRSLFAPDGLSVISLGGRAIPTLQRAPELSLASSLRVLEARLPRLRLQAA